MEKVDPLRKLVIQRQMDDVLEFYDKKFEDLEKGTFYMAGGAVRDCHLGRKPRDFDVFVLGVDIEELLDSEGWFNFNRHRSTLPEDYGGFPEGQLLGTQFVGEKKTQLIHMEPKVRTPQDLFKTFDWTCCCFGYREGDFAYRVPKGLYQGASTEQQIWHLLPVAGKCLQLNTAQPHSPLNTLRRGFIFRDRYGASMRKETQTLLAALAVRGAETPRGLKTPGSSILATPKESQVAMKDGLLEYAKEMAAIQGLTWEEKK